MQITHLETVPQPERAAKLASPAKISKAIGYASVRLEDRVDLLVPIQNNPRWYDQHCSAIRREPP
jgi:hypothetical protein